MKVYIKDINVWLQGLDDVDALILWANGNKNLPKEFTPPKPQYYPKGQLRRLSPFSKVVLHCLDMPYALSQQLPFIFSSQHGDLAKTVTLIKDAAVSEDLSPTQFALSVHNATTGLFGITTDNIAPTTTISATENTFIEGLVEAMMQCQQENSPVIYAYCDFPVPEEYSQFEKNKPARCVAMILSPQSNNDMGTINIALDSQNHVSMNEPCMDLAVDFIRKYYLRGKQVISSENYLFTLEC